MTDFLSVLTAVALAFGGVLQQRRALDAPAVLISRLIRVSTSSPAAQGGG